MSAKKVGPNRRLEYILMAIGTIPPVLAIFTYWALAYWGYWDNPLRWPEDIFVPMIVVAILWFGLFQLIIRLVVDKK